MIEIKGLSEETVWDIASFCYRHPEREQEYAAGDEERFQEGYRRRADYLRRMVPKGARAQIAYEGESPVGFIEYYPIEVTNLEVDGRDVMAIWCINAREEQRGRGIGSMLVEACLQDARQLARRGVVVTCWDPFWMPKAIFERYGFEVVGPAGRNGLVLFKAFQQVEPPKWIGGKPEFHAVEGRLALDIYHTDRCPIHWRNTQLVKEVAGEFASAVEIRQHPTDDRAEMRKHGTAYSVYLNGEIIAAGPLAEANVIRARFEEKSQEV
jgi:ribosomal protein S18 acetylase RimI-like enzyme